MHGLRLLTLGLITLVTSACQQPLARSQAVVTPTAQSAAGNNSPWRSIVLETTPCKGPCPVYRLQIDHTGRVLFEGIAHTAKIGPARAELDATQLQALNMALANADFKTLLPQYDRSNCPNFFTDQSGQRFVFDAEQAYDITRHGGCVSASAPEPGQAKPPGYPAGLVSLGRTMIELVSAQHWLATDAARGN